MTTMWLINAITFSTKAIDDQAWTLFVTGITVVFVALWAIAFILRQIQRVIASSESKTLNRKKSKTNTVDVPKKETVVLNSPDDETNVAIALALHFYMDDQHDEESLVLTINTVDRHASPWAAKTFNSLKK